MYSRSLMLTGVPSCSFPRGTHVTSGANSCKIRSARDERKRVSSSSSHSIVLSDSLLCITVGATDEAGPEPTPIRLVSVAAAAHRADSIFAENGAEITRPQTVVAR
jgi:hypothetical protein